MVQLTGLGGRRKRAVCPEAVQHHVPDRARPEPAVLASEAPFERVVIRNMVRHAVHQRSAGPARGRDRPLRAAGASAAGEPPCPGVDAAVDLGVLAVCQQQPLDLDRDLEQALPDRRSVRARLPVLRPARRARRDPGAGIIPSMFLGALPASAAVSRNLTRARSELAASGVGGQFTSSTRATSRSTASRSPRCAARAGEPPGHRDQGRARRRACRHVAGQVPRRTMAFGLSLWGPDYSIPPTTSPSCRESLSACASAGRRAAIRHSSGWPQRRHDQRPRSSADLRCDPTPAEPIGPVLPADPADRSSPRVDLRAPCSTRSTRSTSACRSRRVRAARSNRGGRRRGGCPR